MNRIIQINLNRSKLAHNHLEELTDRRKIGVIIISEPNINYIEKFKNNYDWTTDSDKTTAVVITPHSNAGIAKKVSRQNHSKVKLENNTKIISCYCSPNCTTTEFEEYLDNITADIDLNNINNTIIAGDFNAANTMWGAKKPIKGGKF